MCSGLQRRCVGWTMVVGWSVQVRFIAAINASHGGVKKRAEAPRGNKVRWMPGMKRRHSSGASERGMGLLVRGGIGVQARKDEERERVPGISGS